MTDSYSLYGNDFDSEQIEKWFSEESAFHDAFVGGRGDEYSFFYHYCNTIYGLRELLRDDINVLDFGCAEGLTLSRSAVSVKYHGVDASKSLLEYAKSRQPEFDFRTIGKDQIIPYSDESFDLILCIGVLHHIPNVSFVLNEFMRVLKPGGHCLVREPITDMRKLDGSRPGLSPNERGMHPKWFSEASSKVGFNLIKTQLCFFGPLNLLRAKTQEKYFIRTIAWADRFVSGLFKPERLPYTRRSHFQKIAPNAAYFTLQKPI